MTATFENTKRNDNDMVYAQSMSSNEYEKYESEANTIADTLTKQAKITTGKHLQKPKYPAGLMSEGAAPKAKISPGPKNVVQLLPVSKINHTTGSVQPQMETKIQSRKGAGDPLPNELKSEMGEKMGSDFGDVKVHMDNKAVEMSLQLNAKAFTHGNDIFFNQSQYSPSTSAGKHLLAHELTHTVQQKGSNGVVQRSSVTTPSTGQEKEETGLKKNEEGMKTWEDRSKDYWMYKLEENLIYGAGVSDRFSNDEEEKNAVLSIAYQKSKTVTGEVIVRIPPRLAAKGSKELFYKFTFSTVPAVDPNKTEKTLTIEFLKEGITITDTTTIPNAPPANYEKKNTLKENWWLTWKNTYPDQDPDAFFAKYPDIKPKLAHYLETAVPGAEPQKEVNKTFRFIETVGAKKKSFYFDVSYSFNVDGRISYSVVYNSKLTEQMEFERTLVAMTDKSVPTAGYMNRTYADSQIESLQEQKPEGLTYKLGKITYPTSILPEEKTPLKYVIYNYFMTGEKHAEVDAIVPITGKNYNVYYTLIFSDIKDGMVNVEAIRIGKDSEKDLMPMNIQNVKGYPATAGAGDLREWIVTRYPGVKEEELPGTTPQLVRDKMNSLMKQGVKTTDWFLKNYNITIYTVTTDAENERKKVLQTVKNYDAQFKTMTEPVKQQTLTDMVVGTKTFSEEDLKTLELSFQAMGDAFVAVIRDQNMKMTRQTQNLILENNQVKAKPSTSGETIDTTITIFDNYMLNDQSMFTGGSSNARTAGINTFTHEIAHVAENKIKDLKKDFDAAFVTNNKVTPFTDYAASDKESEFFPEAMSTYYNDPEWMKKNNNEMYTWFNTQLSKTELDKRK